MNPVLDNDFQRGLETQAAELLNHPAILAVRREGEQQLLAGVPHLLPESRLGFDAAAAEIAFLATVHALNQDPRHPGIHFAELPPRQAGGVSVIGTRGLDDNPDTVYRFIPVDGDSRLTIHGAIQGERPAVNDFSLLTYDWITVGNLAGSDLVIDAKGAFTITIDPDPANGRPNHIQTKPGANYLIIRDTQADWSVQRPNRLTLEQAAPAGPRPVDDALIQLVIKHIRKWFADSVRLHQMAFKQTPNELPQPKIQNSMGMLTSQAYSVGYFELTEDNALVLTIEPGGAGYAIAPITNIWGLSNDPIGHTVSLNTHQAQLNADGSFTVVISVKDPQIYNWVDPQGQRQGFLFLRWAAFDPAKTPTPKVTTCVVPIDSLDHALPPGAMVISAAGRRAQQAERARDYQLRWQWS